VRGVRWSLPWVDDVGECLGSRDDAPLPARGVSAYQDTVRRYLRSLLRQRFPAGADRRRPTNGLAYLPERRARARETRVGLGYELAGVRNKQSFWEQPLFVQPAGSARREHGVWDGRVVEVLTRFR